MEITLDMIDELIERTDVTYEVAKKTLEDANGDLLEAIIILEGKDTEESKEKNNNQNEENKETEEIEENNDGTLNINKYAEQYGIFGVFIFLILLGLIFNNNLLIIFMSIGIIITAFFKTIVK